MCLPTEYANICYCQFIINIISTKIQISCPENSPYVHRHLKDNHGVLGKYSPN